MIYMHDDEQTDDLLVKNLKILQKKNGFRYGTDAVLLSDFAGRNIKGSVLDLCSGTAIVPLLLSVRENISKISALEIQPDIADMAKRSVMLNKLEHKIDMVCGDLKNADSIFAKKSFDAVTCNPPYMKVGGAVTNSSDTKIISRHEVCCTLDDVIAVSRKMLKNQGRLFMVHKPNRLAEIIHTMCIHHIEPKHMRLVYAHKGKEPSLVLIEGLSGGKSEMRIDPPLYIFGENGKYSEELKKIYHMQ